MPLPALLIPALMAGGTALQAVQGNRQMNQQQGQQRELMEIQRQRLMMERAQQLRGNAQEDAQATALNPARANLFAQLGARLGLPAGTMQFAQRGTPVQRGPAPGQRDMGMRTPQTQALPGQPSWVGNDAYSRQAFAQQSLQDANASADAFAGVSGISAIRRSMERQAAQARARAESQFGAAARGQG
jgi:hypothetical protein